MDIESVVYTFIFAVALLISLTLHEAAHAYTAVWMGDDTPKQDGRATLNPFPHIAPLGFVLPILAVLFKFPLLFGWGKPVTVQPGRMRSPRWGHLLVAAAGPLTNMALCVIAIFVSALLEVRGVVSEQSLAKESLTVMIYLNAFLAVFNLFPLPPLDGSTILSAILPKAAREFFEDYIAPYGFYIFLALLLSGKLNGIFVGALNASSMLHQFFLAEMSFP